MSSLGLSFLVILIELISRIKLGAAVDQPNPGCRKTCGNLNISFPFGTSPDCYLDDSFFINCTRNKPLLQKSNIEVVEISPDGQLKVESLVANFCFDSTGKSFNWTNVWLNLETFSISSRRNKFTAVGCNTIAYAQGRKENNYKVGCMSLCNELASVKNGSCSGIGCCQASIPDGITYFQVRARSFSNDTRMLHDFNRCGFAFVTDESFHFSSADLLDFQKRTTVPTVIDYAVGDLTCEQAVKNMSSYACRSEHSRCQDSITGKGYHCNCENGFQGNPYLKGPDGCEDIRECDNLNICKGICTEVPGSFYCTCPDGYEGDGYETCIKKDKSQRNTSLYAALGVVSSLLVLLTGSSWICHVSRKRKLSKLRENFFLKNGGSLLLEKLSAQKGCTTRAIIFTEEDLKKATDNFSEETVIGKGGFGTVHKGVLSDKRIVAIKKSKVTDQSQTEQFINEVIVLSEINHRYVVKLIGCCLETEVPLLVYEFIPNGTLHSHIHDEYLSPIFTWDIRLKVATEAADALGYLHSAASVPIIHRDVKSANILLDKYCNAKVADFGASRFIPIDKTEVTTLVQGTFGYLDPEYFHSSQLTDKSDVYSFGVVLAELLTGQEAVSFNKSEKVRNLAMYFVSSVNDDKLLEILDHHLVVGDGNVEQVVEVGLLAKRCLNVKAEERPTMKEVAIELERLKAVQQHPWTKNDLKYPEETKHLLDHNVSSAAYDSMNDQIIVHLNDGR